MRSQTLNRLAITMLFILWLGLPPEQIQALAESSPEAFYRGKTISWVVASEPGSGTDLVVRTITPFLAKELGVRVKIENMKTDEGINYVYRQGSKDGLTWGVKSSDAIVGNDILKSPGVLYETEKFNYVADVYPCKKIFEVSPKLPYRSLEALRKAKGLKGGGTSAKGSLVMNASIISEILGLDAKIITGFQGRKGLVMALARNEVDFMVTNDDMAARDEQDGWVVNLFAVGSKRSEVVPNIPSLSEVGVKVPKELEAVYRFSLAGGMAVVLPPGVPPEKVEYLRKVFQSLNSNKEMQKALEKVAGAWRSFVSGRELQEELTMIKRDTETAAKLEAIFKKFSNLR